MRFLKSSRLTGNFAGNSSQLSLDFQGVERKVPNTTQGTEQAVTTSFLKCRLDFNASSQHEEFGPKS